MSAFLVLVLLAVPSAVDGSPIRIELHRAVISASSAAACQEHADHKAAELRRTHADLIQRTRGQVAGVCQPLKAST